MACLPIDVVFNILSQADIDTRMRFKIIRKLRLGSPSIDVRPFFTKIFDCIHKAVEQNIVYDSIKDAFDALKYCNVALYKDVCQHTISRRGDIIVGFISSRTTELPLTIGGMECPSVHITPGITYIFENKKMFPLIALQYAEVKINSGVDLTDIYVVYGFLKTFRQVFADSTHLISHSIGTMIIRSYFGIVGPPANMNKQLRDYLRDYPDYKHSYILQ